MIAVATQLPLGGLVGSATQLVADTGLSGPLEASAGLVSALGIVYYQEVNAQFYVFAQGNAMQVVDVS